MAKDNSQLLNHSVEELRRLYDSIAESFEGLRTKALALLAGEVAMVTFLFSSSPSYSLPKPYFVYAIVLYGIGLLLLVISFILLLSVIAPIEWHHPPETKDLRNITKRFKSDEEFLAYLKDEYLESIPGCIRKIGIRSKRFLYAIYILSAGIFLVALLKFGGGTIKL